MRREIHAPPPLESRLVPVALFLCLATGIGFTGASINAPDIVANNFASENTMADDNMVDGNVAFETNLGETVDLGNAITGNLEEPDYTGNFAD